MAATGWHLDEVLNYTYPQLLRIYAKRGRFVYPWVKPTLEATFGQAYADKKELSKYLSKMEQRYQHVRNGTRPIPTEEERKRKRAWDFYVAEYLGLPDEQVIAESPKMPILFLPISAEAAQEIVAWIAEGVPNDVWIDDIMPLWASIQHTAHDTKE